MEQQITFTCRTEHIFRNENDDVIIRMNADEFNFFLVRKNLKRSVRSPKLSVYVEQLSQGLESEHRYRTAEAYRCAARSLILFLKGRDISLSRMDAKLMHNYQDYLKKKGNSLNTISFYLRNIRAIYNKGVLEKQFAPSKKNPFCGLYTGVYETQKRALKKEEMQQLSSFSSSSSYGLISKEYRSLLYFLFCFHARGMSFVDLVFLRKSSLEGNHLIYRRRKTGRLLTLSLTDKMLQIIRYFSKETKNSPYLFPIIDPDKGERYQQYLNALRSQNILLKSVSKKIGLHRELSTHIARHSWATIAKQENVPFSVISEALGHRDEKTTSIYLDSFEESLMDKISKKISKVVECNN